MMWKNSGLKLEIYKLCINWFP